MDALNINLWGDIYHEGEELLFGDKDAPKKAKEMFIVTQIYGNALDRLYNGDVPEGWLFRGAANKEYINALKNPDKGDQPYTYGQRLAQYPVWDGSSFLNTVSNHSTGEEFQCEEFDGCEFVNQLERSRELLRIDIETGIQSNRNCGIIWHPLDAFLQSPACFQWYQVRKSDKNNVSARVLFRSHAYDNGCFPNWGAIVRTLRDIVIEPAGGVLEELICVSVSAEIEYSNMDMVEALVGKIPTHIRRLLK